VDAYAYSSATGSWSAPTMCPRELRGLTMSGPRAGVVDGRGTAHWLYRDALHFYTLDISADAARVSLAEIPIRVEGEHERRVMRMMQPPFPCIVQGGKLSFVYVRQPYGARLKFCTKRDKGWRHYELPMFHVREPLIYMPFASFKIIGFAEGRGALLVRSYFAFFLLDLESRELKLIRRSQDRTYPTEDCSSSMCQGYNSCTQCAYNSCVLYEMDWSSYLLHLSAWSPRSGATT
jgi:hypothetical protein